MEMLTEYLAKGFHVFALKYAVRGYAYPLQLLQSTALIHYLRTNAVKLNVNPQKISVVGFSAGGHLVGNLAIAHQRIAEISGKALNCKPTAVGLCYPVISRVFKYQQT